MLFQSPVPAAALAILCLVPAAVRWWSGRSLLPLLDDPVLPERLLAHRRRGQSVLWFVVVSVIVLGGFGDLVWAAPLIVFTRLAAGYPLRRALFDERWTLAAYMSTMARLWLAAGGFWLLVVAMPLVAGAAGSLDWLAALALGELLLAWNARYAEVVRWLVRARPFPDGPLLARFQAIAAASRAPQPRFELVDLGGGAIANALALGSLRGSSVLYTDTLVRLLDADEAAAITAHEMAHLEHFDTARLRRLNTIGILLISGGVATVLVRRLAPPEWTLLLPAAIWSVVMVAALAWMARDRQRNETASDLRAVELAGDPDVLIRALTRVYAFSRVPRRFDAEMERMASHPSLARRIRAIREAAGVPRGPELPDPERVQGIGGKVVVTFERDRLHWQESEGVAHVLSYSHLTELGVRATATGGTRLVALESGGRRWDVALEAAEAARAQAVLDRVDARLAEPAARSASAPLLQVAGAGVAICAMWLGHVLVAVVALGASLRSAAAFFAAAGGAALGAAGLAGRQAIATRDAASAWPALLLTLFGVALLAGAWRKREDEASRVVHAGVAGLAVLVLLSLTLIAMRGRSAVGLNQASLAFPSAAVLPLALAAVFVCKPHRRWRLAAIPIALVGVTVGIAGSGSFLYAFGRDPFLTTGQRMPVETLTASPVADFRLPGAVTDLRLSPGGRQIAVLRSVMSVGMVASFSVGAPGSQLEPLGANDLVFLDDQRVLTLAVDGVDTVVREVTLQPRAIAWEHRVRNLQAPRLAYRPVARRWFVTGATFDAHLVSVEAAVGSPDVQRREWNMPDRQGWGDAWAIDGDTVLVAQKRFDFDPADGSLWGLTMMAMLDHMRTRLTRITPNGTTEIATSQLDVTCSDRVFDAERLVCMAFDGASTHLLTVAPGEQAPQPIGSLAGQFVSYRPTRDGWLSGWVTTGVWINSSQLAVDVVSRRAIAIPSEFRADELTVVGRMAGTLAHDATSTRVRLYRIGER